MKIIGLAGKKHSGKSTIAEFFVKGEKFTNLAFADPLKDLLSRLFSIDIKYFTDEKLKESELPDKITIDYKHLDKLRSIVETEWNFTIDNEQRNAIEEFYGDEIKTPRQLMQIFGTDILRRHVADDIWITLLFNRMKEISGNVVVSDVRLLNERQALKKAGAQLWLIKRSAVNSNDNHSSENDLGKDDEYHVIVKNEDVSLAVLRSECMMWYSIKMEK